HEPKAGDGIRLTGMTIAERECAGIERIAIGAAARLDTRACLDPFLDVALVVHQAPSVLLPLSVVARDAASARRHDDAIVVVAAVTWGGGGILPLERRRQTISETAERTEPGRIVARLLQRNVRQRIGVVACTLFAL